jgi:hypothetical protein
MAVPTFLGIGAMKAGTTTIHEYCCRHPEIFSVQEVDWFFTHLPTPRGSQAEYEARFPDHVAVRGEISSHYDQYLPQIAAVYPGIKLIYAVRHPIDRFISDVRHMQTFDGRPDFTIENILASYWSGREIYWQISSGFYQRTILRAQRCGLPLHLINFDLLIRDQQTVWDGLTDYLGVARFTCDAIHAHSSDGRVAIVPTDDQYAQLATIYASTLQFLRNTYAIDF